VVPTGPPTLGSPPPQLLPPPPPSVSPPFGVVGGQVVATGPPTLGSSPPPLLPPPRPPPLPPPGEQPPSAALPVATAVGPKPFVQWIRSLTPERLDAVTAGLTAFTEAEAQWRAENKVHVEGARSLPKGKFRVAQLLNYKRAVGMRFLGWKATAGKESKSMLKACCLCTPESLQYATPGPVIARTSRFLDVLFT